MDPIKLDELIDKYASGEMTVEEWEELIEWYRSAKVEEVEWPSDDPGEREHLQQRMLVRLQDQLRSTPKRTIPLRAWHVAASLLILFSSFWMIRQIFGHNHKPTIIVANNPSGKIMAVLLPDSSRVWLNAASSLHYSSTFGRGNEGRREIYLEGEGFFDVREAPSHPFVVHAGTLTTTVLGTRFEVKSFAGESLASVAVMNGKVGVRDTAHELGVLTAARQLQVDARTGKSSVAAIDTGQVMGWRLGKLQFYGQTLQEIAASLGRWYSVRFIFADPRLAGCRYYLNFENSIPLDRLLAVLKETTDLDFQSDEHSHIVTISGAACQ